MVSFNKDYYLSIKDMCLDIFNSTFKTDFKIELLTTEEDKKLNPNSGINYEKSGGYYHLENKKIVIFLDKLEMIFNSDYVKVNNQDKGITFLILAIFHELNHRLQREYIHRVRALDLYTAQLGMPLEPFYKFMIELEFQIMGDISNKEDFYARYHDNLLFEIDADIKGVRNSIFFAHKLKNANVCIDYYNYYSIYNEFRIASYDPQFFIERFNAFLSKGVISAKKINTYFSNPVISEFFSSDGQYKTVSEIMNNPVIAQCNHAIVYSLMSSSYFLDRIDVVSEHEREFLLKCMLFTYKRYKRNTAKREELYSKAEEALSYIVGFVGKSREGSQRNLNTLAIPSYYKLLESKLIKYGIISGHVYVP